MGTYNGTRGGAATKEAPKQRPAHTIRYGRGLKATIWRQESDKGPWYTTVISRTYKTDAGYQSSQSFGLDHLLVVSKLANDAHTWIHRQMAQDGANAGSGDADVDEGGAGTEAIPF